MKKLFLIFLLTFVSFNLFATEYKQTYEKKNVYTNHFLYMYEVYEDNKLVCYRIDTRQRPNYNKNIECTIISENKKAIMKLLSGLVDCYENDYYKYISNYSGLTFLDDEYGPDDFGRMTERYCYEIK